MQVSPVGQRRRSRGGYLKKGDAVTLVFLMAASPTFEQGTHIFTLQRTPELMWPVPRAAVGRAGTQGSGIPATPLWASVPPPVSEGSARWALCSCEHCVVIRNGKHGEPVNTEGSQYPGKATARKPGPGSGRSQAARRGLRRPGPASCPPPSGLFSLLL